MKQLGLLVVVFFIQGCTSSTGGYFASFNEVKYQISHKDVMINDVVTTLRKYYTPGKTTLSLFLENEDVFSARFANALMHAGYGVSINEGRLGYVPLAYKLDSVGPLVRITVNVEKLQFSRVYKESEDTLKPFSPITVRGD